MALDEGDIIDEETGLPSRKVEVDGVAPDYWSGTDLVHAKIERPRKILRSRLLILGAIGAVGLAGVAGLAAIAAKRINDTIETIIATPFPLEEPSKPVISQNEEEDPKSSSDSKSKSSKYKLLRNEEDAPIDKEEDDHSYDDTGEAPSKTLSKAPNKRSLKEGEIETDRETSIQWAQKLLSRGGLRSSGLGELKREKWAEAIVDEMISAKITLSRETLIIAIVTVDRESGFQTIGVVNGPEKVLDRQINEFKRENPRVYGLMEGSVADLRARALEFIRSRREINLANEISYTRSDGTKVGYFTEKDINLAIDFAIEIYESKLAPEVKLLYPKESLDKYRPKTFGCMQLNVRKAIELAKDRERPFYSEAEMRKALGTREGGLHYGMLYLREIIAANKRDNKRMSPDEIKRIFLDFNMGAFTTRNAAIQKNLNRLGAKLSVDGDLLSYDENGMASERESDSMKAILDVLKDKGATLSPVQIRQDLLQEKSAKFESTETYRRLKVIFASHGLTETNTMPSVKAKGSFVKFGTDKITGEGYVKGSYRRYGDLQRTLSRK